ncbi:MAG TPA: hypothetical protein P5121_35750 [Caldilineaceae bacterium]|nr:hypothetical protein [Caldilineaceae bacterium]
MAAMEQQLTEFVRQGLADTSATISDYRVDELTGGFSGAAVHRFHGEAATTAGVRPWSLVRKRCHPENGSTNPTDHNYWRREVAYYESDLGAARPPHLNTPHCFDIEAAIGSGWRIWGHRNSLPSGQWRIMALLPVISDTLTVSI